MKIIITINNVTVLDFIPEPRDVHPDPFITARQPRQLNLVNIEHSGDSVGQYRGDQRSQECSSECCEDDGNTLEVVESALGSELLSKMKEGS